MPLEGKHKPAGNQDEWNGDPKIVGPFTIGTLGEGVKVHAENSLMGLSFERGSSQRCYLPR